MKPLVVATLLVLATAPAKTETLIGGIGGNSCARFLSDIKTYSTGERDYYDWAIAFMTGLNAMATALKGRTINIKSMNTPQHMPFLRSDCEAHPSEMFLDTAARLFATLPYHK